MENKPKKKKRSLLALGIIVLCLVIAYFVISQSDYLSFFKDGEAVKQWIIGLGLAGPVIVMALMTIAIVISPLPSAPIALAAGAVYGHYEGALYVATGAEIGAIIAFYIARLSGVDMINDWMGGRLKKTLVGSQNSLMVIIFVSRLLPFLSFDVISYAAGMTHITFWRFAIATFAGIIPASYILAHFGAEMASEDTTRIAIALVVLGLFTLIPVIVQYYQRRKNPQENQD
ncbi:MAG: TVP38/TMEM64 family protein [Thiohalomonadales bacterium]